MHVSHFQLDEFFFHPRAIGVLILLRFGSILVLPLWEKGQRVDEVTKQVVKVMSHKFHFAKNTWLTSLPGTLDLVLFRFGSTLVLFL